MLEKIDERAGRVLHVAEAARLVAVAVDLERLVRERGAHEAGDDHPVLAALPRADGVEEARDDDAEIPLLGGSARARNSSSAFESAYAQRFAVVGP